VGSIKVVVHTIRLQDMIDYRKAFSSRCAKLGVILDMIGSFLNWKVHDLTTTTNWGEII
jgi:hypothetical protein